MREVEVPVVDELRHLLEEEGHQQRGDVGAVDVGVGHQDDLVVAQVVLAIAVAGAAAERLDQVGDLLVGRHLVARGAGDVEHLAAQRQHGLAGAVARLLGAAAGRVALDDEDLGALGGRLRAVGELAGQAELSRRALAGRSPFPCGGAGAPRRARWPSRAAWSAWLGEAASQWSKASRSALSTMRVASGELSLSLVWPTNSGSRTNTESMAMQWASTSSAVRIAGALVAGELGIGAEAAEEGGAQARFVRAAFGGRDGVAVGVEEAVAEGPGDRPFDRAVAAGLADAGPRRFRRRCAARPRCGRP